MRGSLKNLGLMMAYEGTNLRNNKLKERKLSKGCFTGTNILFCALIHPKFCLYITCYLCIIWNCFHHILPMLRIAKNFKTLTWKKCINFNIESSHGKDIKEVEATIIYIMFDS